MKPGEIPMRVMRKYGLANMYELEAALAARPEAVHAAADSPERFEIIAHFGETDGGPRPPATPRAMPHMMASILGILRSMQSLSENPSDPRTQIPDAELLEVGDFARSVGIADIGYTRVPGGLVFRNKAVLHENAIVLTMEMDKARIDTSPSKASVLTVMETYHRLGVASNRIAGLLRKRGYSAHAGHPPMGLALYPPLAQQAGLGWRGLHGLLITPRFGPRVRLAAVFTGIENLPFDGENDHRWIEDYCRLCKVCVRECPPQAIFDRPVAHDNGLVTCVDSERCFPYFAGNYGCSVCIRVCPFQTQDYAALRSRVAGSTEPAGM